MYLPRGCPNKDAFDTNYKKMTLSLKYRQTNDPFLNHRQQTDNQTTPARTLLVD